MRRLGSLAILIFGGFSIALGLLLTLYRHNPISHDWATLAEAVQTPSGYTIRLTLFHPELRFQRELITLETDSLPSVRWSPDGQWLLMALQPRANQPTLYRVHWSGRNFAAILQIQRSFALSATEWSPSGEWGILVETRQYRGDVFLLNANGSILKTLLSDLQFFIIEPYIRWSPDGQWAIAAFALSDTETALYRIDGRTFEIESLPSLDGTLETLEISPDGEWMTYVLRHQFGEPPIYIYRMRVDGTQPELLARDQLKIIPELWWTEQGDLMAKVEDLAGTDYFIGRVDTDEQAIIPIVDGLPVASRLRPSHDGRYLATEVPTAEADYILVMTADGQQQWQYPAEEFCMFFDPRWSPNDEWVMFLRRRVPNEGVCEFHRVRPAENDVQAVLPGDLADFDIDTSAADHPQWLSTLHTIQNRDERRVIPTLFNQKTGELIPLPNGRVIAWSSAPIRTEDTRLPIVMGIICLCVTLVLGGLAKHKE